VTLELGGKSPTIVSASADLERAAASLVMAKALNAGQTCIAPDYVLVHEDHRTAFAKAFTQALQKQYPALSDTPDYSSLISDRHFDRQLELLQDARDQGATIVSPELGPQPARSKSTSPCADLADQRHSHDAGDAGRDFRSAVTSPFLRQTRCGV
jgi:coniferyl-aldehyde dehydrogenase